MEVGGFFGILMISGVGLIVFLVFREIAKETKATQENKRTADAPQNAAEMQDPDYLKNRLRVDPYEKAMKELESGDTDNAVWAKAFAQSENDDATKRLYVKLRAEILQGESLNGLTGDQDLEEKKPFRLFSLQGFAYVIAVVPPGSLIGAWLINSANDLPTRFMDVASGQTWLAFVLWPFAIGYIVWKRNQ